MVYARNLRIAQEISRQIRDRTVEKTYLAIVQCKPAQTLPGAEGVIQEITANLKTDDGRVSVAPEGSDEGKNTYTKWISMSTSVSFEVSFLPLLVGLSGFLLRKK
jgi:23S rRNA-/tRNA-specific pseudouridylate synthase